MCLYIELHDEVIWNKDILIYSFFFFFFSKRCGLRIVTFGGMKILIVTCNKCSRIKYTHIVIWMHDLINGHNLFDQCTYFKGFEKICWFENMVNKSLWIYGV